MVIPDGYGYGHIVFVRQGLWTQLVCKGLEIVAGGVVLERGGGLGSASFIVNNIILPGERG